MNDNLYHIKGETLEGIADAIREMRQETGTMTPPQMKNKIENTILGVPVSIHINPLTEEWERSSNWPDLDSINMPEGFDGCYLTYDLTKIADPWIGLISATNNGGPWRIARGHLVDGEFISDESYTVENNGYFRQALDSTYGNIQLWRITPVNASDTLGFYGFVSSSATAAESRFHQLQPCVERKGIMDYAVILSGSTGTDPTYTRHTTMWLECDGLIIGRLKKLTSIAYGWYCAHSLQKIDFSECDTSLWQITTMYSAFCECSSLLNLDLSTWDTTNWNVTSMIEMCGYCYSLRSLDFHTWAVSSWNLTRMDKAFNEDHSLRTLSTPTNLYCNSTTSSYSFSPNLYTIQNFTGYPISVNHSYANARMLTVQSLLNIITALPTVTGTKTITLSHNKTKLTSAQIAVATQKGWTVA